MDARRVARLEDSLTGGRFPEHRADARQGPDLDAPNLGADHFNAGADLGDEESKEEVTGSAADLIPADRSYAGLEPAELEVPGRAEVGASFVARVAFRLP